MQISYEWRDAFRARNVARITVHDGKVYLETEGNHDGVAVCTAVQIPREAFVAGLRHLGGLL